MASRRMRVTAALAVAALLVPGLAGPAASTATATAATGGWLDPTFGTHGVVAVPTATAAFGTWGGVGVGSTGRIAVVSTYRTSSGGARNELAVFTASGRLDGSFHGGHVVSLFADPVGECCGADGPFVTADGGVDVGLVTDGSVVVQRYGSTGVRAWRTVFGVADGSTDAVLAGGSVRGLGITGLPDQATPPPLWLLGLTSAGARDTRVGPNGIRVLSELAGPNALVADAANRLYVVGNTYADLNAAPAGRSMVITRLTSSGVVDPSYGTAGATTIPVDDTDTSPAKHLVALASDGTLFIVGQTGPAGARVMVIRKVDPDGTLDGSFGSGGVATLPARLVTAIAVDATGRPVLSILKRGSPAQPAIIRLDPTNGTLDAAFGTSGTVLVSSLVTDLAVTPNGKLLTISRVARNGAFVEYLARRSL